MGLIQNIATLANIPGLLKLKKGLQPKPLDIHDCIGARIESTAAKHAQHTAIVFEGSTITWSEFNKLTNRYARIFKDRGLIRGDAACVMMENRIEFLAVIVGLNKIGVTAGLLNTNLTGRSLQHCIKVISAKHCIFGAEVMPAITEVHASLDLVPGSDFLFVPDTKPDSCPAFADDLTLVADSADDTNPADTGDNILGQTAFYIYTSGTTGLPKAAVMSNRRYLASADLSGKAGLKTTASDRIYLCLPLYHATGLLMGVGSSFTTGASMFIRRRFSASNFFSEIRDYQCSHMVYIGELCRYLTNIPQQPGERLLPLHTIMGNGMRPDIWMNFKTRYGIKRICEIYGASEGNVAFANLLNKDCTVGMTTSEVLLVKYDVDQDEILRDASGKCIPVSRGEAGLLLSKITPESKFEGYTDENATEGKIIRDAIKDGDSWFNTGDLMRVIDVGYALGYDHYQFVDRVGDTYRWKSENVSTNEVGEIINGFPQIKFCNVYGVVVPHAEGKAGMVSITLNDGESELDLVAFADFVRQQLPPYAVPVFIRIDEDIDVTGTFKMLKGDLRKQAYDFTQIPGAVYVMRSGDSIFTAMDHDYKTHLDQGTAGF